MQSDTLQHIDQIGVRVLATNRLSAFSVVAGVALSGQASDQLSGGRYAATDRSSVNSWPWALYLASILGPW